MDISAIFFGKIVSIILFVSFNISLEAQKNSFKVRDCSFEYPQHMFWLKNKKIKF